jgi:hypothetical protein
VASLARQQEHVVGSDGGSVNETAQRSQRRALDVDPEAGNGVINISNEASEVDGGVGVFVGLNVDVRSGRSVIHRINVDGNSVIRRDTTVRIANSELEGRQGRSSVVLVGRRSVSHSPSIRARHELADGDVAVVSGANNSTDVGQSDNFECHCVTVNVSGSRSEGDRSIFVGAKNNILRSRSVVHRGDKDGDAAGRRSRARVLDVVVEGNLTVPVSSRGVTQVLVGHGNRRRSTGSHSSESSARGVTNGKTRGVVQREALNEDGQGTPVVVNVSDDRVVEQDDRLSIFSNGSPDSTSNRGVIDVVDLEGQSARQCC